MTSIEKPNGTWTFMNIFSFSKDPLNNGNVVSCKVQFNSTSDVVVHYQLVDHLIGPIQDNCQSYLIPVLTLALLLLVALSAHLLWIHKETGKKHIHMGNTLLKTGQDIENWT